MSPHPAYARHQAVAKLPAPVPRLAPAGRCRVFLKNDAKDAANSVQANSRVLNTKDLVLGINDKFANKKAAEIIKRGVAKIDPDKIIKDYMAKNIK